MNKDLKETRAWELQEFWEKNVLWREKSRGKGPEARVCLADSRNSKEATWLGRRAKGGVVRD